MKRSLEINQAMIKKINNFWRWFADNSEAIKRAFLLRDNAAEVFFHFDRNLGYISKRIDYIIKCKTDSSGDLKIIFTAHGYRKLVPKVIALTDNCPPIHNWFVQAFIQPSQKIEEFRQGLDEPFIFPDFELKTSEMKFAPLDYDITLKKLKIVVFIKNYKYHFENDFLPEAIFIILEELVGEIAYRKNIKLVQLAQLPEKNDNLIHLYELQEYIDYLNNINRGKLII
jgi:hypothetical protein